MIRGVFICGTIAECQFRADRDGRTVADRTHSWGREQVHRRTIFDRALDAAVKSHNRFNIAQRVLRYGRRTIGVH